MASEAMVSVAQLEVVVRNAIDAQLQLHFKEKERGIPWFTMGWLNERQQNGIDVVSQRLAKEESDGTLRKTRDQIIAGQNFGFWESLLVASEQNLWDQCLHKAFPYGLGKRNQIQGSLNKIRKFRNKLAHHDSLRQSNVLTEMERIFETAGFVSPLAEKWMRQATRWEEIHSECPVKTKDVVVVAGNVAWEVYKEQPFYVCQAGRHFRDVEYLAFYENSSIRKEVPKIEWIRDDVEWTESHAHQLVDSGNRADKKLGELILWSLNEGAHYGWGYEKYKVFKLTRVGNHYSGHMSLRDDLPHATSGRGSAFTQRQRYVSKRSLVVAKTTLDLTEDN